VAVPLCMHGTLAYGRALVLIGTSMSMPSVEGQHFASVHDVDRLTIDIYLSDDHESCLLYSGKDPGTCCSDRKARQKPGDSSLRV
jgi:hypothetical protein